MAKHSCGILLFKYDSESRLRVLIGHMGGPFWAKKENHAWSIIKGEVEDGEEPDLDVALREFHEETGYKPDKERAQELGAFKQPSGKVIHVWVANDEWNEENFIPGMFTMEWPKGSGQIAEFPEIDRVAWLLVPDAEDKLIKGQLPILTSVTEKLGYVCAEGETDFGSDQGSLF